MPRKTLLTAVSALLVLLLVAVLAVLTELEEDPCANPQADISAAILAEGDGDQDALANRAIIMRGACKQQDQDND